MQTTPNPQMAIIGKIFPIIFAFISWTAASGVALYFATTNLWQIGQQEIVYRTIVTAAGPPPKANADDEDPGNAKRKPDRSAGPSEKSSGSGGTSNGKAGKPSTKSGGADRGSQSGGGPSRSGQARSNRKRKR
jgi:membrane protein insertase Oxa1/YidC/SpoIIIJ